MSVPALYGTKRGKLHRVPALPPHHLPRQQQLNDLKELVLRLGDEPLGITGEARTCQQTGLGLQGMGGIGKSVLAAALVREPDIAEAFPDGIVWVTLGREAPNVLARIADLIFQLTNERPGLVDLPSAQVHLEEALADRKCLIVLDDVWNADDARWFECPDSPSQLLITTRDASLLSAAGAIVYSLETLSTDEALDLLAGCSGVSRRALPDSARDVAAECGCLPLAIALCGAQVRDGILWDDLLCALRAAELDYLYDPHHPQGSVLKSIKVSVDSLGADDAQRYLELAVFPEDTAIPEAALETLWGRDGRFAKRDLHRLVTKLANRALLRLKNENGQRRVRLHDLQQDYVRKAWESAVGGLSGLHNVLVEAYRALCKGGRWSDGPNDGYYFQHLPYHLVQAGRAEDVRSLLLDFCWLCGKLAATDVYGVMADYGALLSPDCRLEEDLAEPPRLILGALVLSAHVLIRDRSQLAGQLIGRLAWAEVAEIRVLLANARLAAVGHTEVAIVPRAASLTPPGGRLLRTLEGHSGAVNSCAFFYDGRRALSGADDKTLKVWNLDTGECLRTLEGHSSEVSSSVVFPGGHRALSGSYDKTLKVWNLESGACLKTLRNSGCVLSCALSSDGRLALAASSDELLTVWDVESDACHGVLHGHSSGVTSCVVFAHDRRVLSGSNDKTLKIWDIDSGTCTKTLNGHDRGVTCCVVFPVGSRFCALSASYDRTLKVWDLENGVCLKTLEGHSAYVMSCAVSTDGTRAVSVSSDCTLKLWDLREGVCLETLKAHNSVIMSCALFSSGHRALSGADDNSIKVWDLKSVVQVKTVERHGKLVFSCSVCADGRSALSTSADNSIKLWDLERCACVKSLEGHDDWVWACSIFADGTRALSASKDKTLKVWDLNSGKCLTTLKDHSAGVKGCAVSADGLLAVSASYDKTLKVWDLQSGSLVRTIEGHHGMFSCLLFSDGRRMLSVSSDALLKVWDVHTGECLQTLEGHTRTIMSCALFPDEMHAISASDDHTVRIWDLRTGRCVNVIKRRSGSAVYCCTPIGDGRRVLFASQDKTLSVWDIESYTCLDTFTGESAMVWCGVTRDGRRVVAGDFDGCVHFLELVEFSAGDRGAEESKMLGPDLDIPPRNPDRPYTEQQGPKGSSKLLPDGASAARAPRIADIRHQDLHTPFYKEPTVPYSFQLGDYQRDLDVIKAWNAMFWAHIQHPHFTLHGPKHSESIIAKIGGWLRPCSLVLTPVETFILLGAAWLHDIGMQCQNSKFLAEHCGIQRKTMLDRDELNIVRAHHGELSFHMIRDAVRAPGRREYPELNLDGTARSPEFNAIALISKAHCSPITADITNNYHGVSGGAVRLLLLAHLLRVGDALDAEESRTNKDYYRNADWASFLPVDKFHWLKHQYVASIEVSGAGVFRFNYTIPAHEDVHRDLIRACAERPLRQHLSESGAGIRALDVPFSEVESHFISVDPVLTFQMDEAALAEFRRMAGSNPQ